MKHLFLTGEKQIGKSTLIQKWLSGLNLSIGGFCTRKHMSEDGRLTTHMLSASDPRFPCEDNMLFDCRKRDKKKAAEQFDRIGVSLLQNTAGTDLIVIDEIGLMERDALLFQDSVLRTLDGDIPVIGVLRELTDAEKQTMPDCLIRQIAARSDVRIIRVTVDNRDALASHLPAELAVLTASDRFSDP